MTVARQIQFSDNTVGEEEIAAVTGVLAGRWLSAGPVTREFERAFAAALGVPDAVLVSSGTAALHLALAALGVGPGDEVITPALTFVAGAAMTRLLGATPVFADVRSEHDLTVDPGAVRELITGRTKVIVAMHYGGFAADVGSLRAIADDAGVAVLEDAAHAPVVRTPAGMLGTIGAAGCFSFYATKNVTMGEGGIIVATDAERLAACRSMRSHCLTVSASDRDRGARPEYDVTGLGMNYRPTDITAALGLAQFGRLAADRERRRALVTRYRERLSGIPGLIVPFAGRDLRAQDTALHLFVVLLPPGTDRAAVRAALTQRGVPTSVHYPPTHGFSFYAGPEPSAQLPMTDRIAPRLLTLPLHARMTDEDADFVAGALDTVLATAGRAAR